jgi:DNA replication and repair protein RecF
VFEKLDAGRMENLLEYICHRIKAQIFLTDTHPQRMRDIFEKLGKKIQEIYV